VIPHSVLRLPADAAPVASLDFETTGLHSDAGHRVVEVGVVRIDPATGRRRAFSSLVHPGGPISLRTQAIHGISDEMVADAPPFSEILPEITALVEGAVFIAHNAPFDLGFLRAEAKRSKLPPPEPAAVIDTLAMARHVFRLPSCSLSAVADRIGLPFHGAHRALADARAALAVYQEMVANLSPGDAPTVSELLAIIEAASSDTGPARVRKQLESALAEGTSVAIDYTSFRSRGTLTTRRIITVIQLKHRKVEAFCHLRQARRTFRIERIRNVSPEPTESETLRRLSS
jgi:DNA polymerase-3 subunit epsilon